MAEFYPQTFIKRFTWTLCDDKRRDMLKEVLPLIYAGKLSKEVTDIVISEEYLSLFKEVARDKLVEEIING